jgi:hypothetical protein
LRKPAWQRSTNARTYAEAARADRTQRAYHSDLAHFQEWRARTVKRCWWLGV